MRRCGSESLCHHTLYQSIRSILCIIINSREMSCQLFVASLLLVVFSQAGDIHALRINVQPQFKVFEGSLNVKVPSHFNAIEGSCPYALKHQLLDDSLPRVDTIEACSIACYYNDRCGSFQFTQEYDEVVGKCAFSYVICTDEEMISRKKNSHSFELYLTNTISAWTNAALTSVRFEGQLLKVSNDMQIFRYEGCCTVSDTGDCTHGQGQYEELPQQVQDPDQCRDACLSDRRCSSLRIVWTDQRDDLDFSGLCFLSHAACAFNVNNLEHRVPVGVTEAMTFIIPSRLQNKAMKVEHSEIDVGFPRIPAIDQSSISGDGTSVTRRDMQRNIGTRAVFAGELQTSNCAAFVLQLIVLLLLIAAINVAV